MKKVIFAALAAIIFSATAVSAQNAPTQTPTPMEKTTKSKMERINKADNAVAVAHPRKHRRHKKAAATTNK